MKKKNKRLYWDRPFYNLRVSQYTSNGDGTYRFTPVDYFGILEDNGRPPEC